MIKNQIDQIIEKKEWILLINFDILNHLQSLSWDFNVNFHPLKIHTETKLFY